MDETKFKKLTNLAYIINAVFAALVLLSTIFYLNFKNLPYVLKTLSSALFVACGLFNLVFSWIAFRPKGRKLAFMIMMLCGLILACVGDILLIDHFILGAVFFAAGHIVFFAAMIVLSGFCLRDGVVSTLIFVAAFLLIALNKNFDFAGMKSLVIAYALVLSLMLGKSVSNAFNVNNRWFFVLVSVGAALFFVSDLMLLFYIFAGKLKILDILCLSTYYPAEIVLAFSIFACAVGFTEYKMKKVNTKNN